MKNGTISSCVFFIACYLCSCSGTGSTTTTPENSPTQTPEVKTVFVNGDTIHYLDVGKGEPVVFVHGTLGDYRSWVNKLDTFSKKYRAISYSRRYAYPDKNINDSSDFSVTPHGKDLGAFLKALNAGPAHLIGHSYGGYAALLATIENPELVKTLSLAEPPVMPLLQNVPGGDTMFSNFQNNTFLPAREAFRNNDTLNGIKIFITGVMGDSAYFTAIPPYVMEVFKENIEEMKGTAFTDHPFPTITCDDLKKVKAPVLLMEGDKSPRFFHSITTELARCLPKSETVTFQNTSHGFPNQNALLFDETVLRFLEKN